MPDIITFSRDAARQVIRAMRKVNSGGVDLRVAPDISRSVRIGIPMKIKEVHHDYLKCRTFYNRVEGTQDILVAKPFLLRAIPSRRGRTFEYTPDTESAPDGANSRTVTFNGQSEEEFLLETWEIGDEIVAWAMHGPVMTIDGVPVVYHTDDGGRFWSVEPKPCP